MKVLHFTTVFSSISQTFLYDTIILLQKEGIENHVVTLSRENVEKRPFKNVYPLFGNYKKRKYTFNIFTKTFWKLFFESPQDFFLKLVKLYFLPAWIFIGNKKLDRLFFKIKPDIIHCHFGWGFYNLYKFWGDKCFQYPIVISLHGSDIILKARQNTNYLNVLLKACKEKNVQFTVNSDYFKNICISFGLSASKIHVVYNTFNEMFLNRRKSKFSVIKESISIVCIGRFVRWKGHQYLIEAFSMFHKESPGSRLTLIGSGDTKNEMRQLVKDLNLESNVCFLGDVDHSELPDLLRQHDVYVQPSIVDSETKQVETFGVSILEAIMVGLPVIVTRSGGIPETVGENFIDIYAFFVEPGDSHAIYSVMKQLNNEYAFQSNSEYVRDRLKHFSNEKYVKHLKKVYGFVI